MNITNYTFGHYNAILYTKEGCNFNGNCTQCQKEVVE